MLAKRAELPRVVSKREWRCGCSKELGYKNPKIFLSVRTEWAEPLHYGLPDQSGLSFRNASWSNIPGELADFSQFLVFVYGREVTIDGNMHIYAANTVCIQ